MLNFPYRFALTLFGEDGTNVGTALAQIDWEPAHEWTRLHFQRKGALPPDAEDEGASILPVWATKYGEPYCNGFRIEIARPGCEPVGWDFPNTYFKDFAGTVASGFVEQSKLRSGEVFTYIVVAYPTAREPAAMAGLRMANASPGLPTQEGSIETFLGRARPEGVIDADDLPVFVAEEVLEQAAAQTRTHEGTETGGILIGKLWRDVRAGEIFVEVTAQIPAEHTSGSNVKLSFTPQTWTAAEAALRLRRSGEVYLGYFHSHPVREWCRSKACTPEAQKTCSLARDFFSADDKAVMRAAFPRAYSIAIVANDTAFDLSFSMFGNRRGVTHSRGFYVLEGSGHGA
jgi:Prokaryotic homologs of the JAB domain